MPEIQVRGTSLSSLRESNYQPMSYMFDEAWFRESLQMSCPQLQVHDHVGDIMNFNRAHVPPSLEHFTPDAFFYKHNHTSTFRQDVLEVLQYTPSVKEPAIVRIAPLPFILPIRIDPDEFYTSFGLILRMRQDLVDIAGSVLDRLRKLATSLSNGNQNLWIGAHLRTESDAASIPTWPTYDFLRDGLFQTAEKRSCRLIYVATGDMAHLDKLRIEANQKNITIITKTDLMRLEDTDYMTTLTWDQKALVDYHVLRPAPFLIGSSMSSFASQLAWSRHLEIRRENFTWPEDEMSRLLGREEPIFTTGMWPLA